MKCLAGLRGTLFVCNVCLTALATAWLTMTPGKAENSPAAACGFAAPRKAPTFDADRFVRLLRAKRDDVRAQALTDAERFHAKNPDLSDALWQAIQHDLQTKRIGEILFRAIRLHGSLPGAQVVEQQIALLSAEDARVVALAADNLAAIKAPDALSPLLRLVERSEYRTHYGFRHAVVSAVAQFEDRASVGFLVNVLAKTDGQLKYETFRQLARLTGQDFGGDAGGWQKWWRENRDRFAFAVAVEQPAVAKTAVAPRPASWDYAVPTFFGEPVFAKRLVFVIDQSKSMLSSVDGVTRMEEAQNEFEAAVRKLPDDAVFDVLAYDSTVTSWQGALVPATPLQKADAIRFVTTLTPNNKTACYDALAEALNGFPEAESVLFLSDGEPTAGTIVDRPTILQEITRLNRFHRTSINTIGIDARGISEEFMRQLAQSNFGVFRSIR